MDVGKPFLCGGQVKFFNREEWAFYVKLACRAVAGCWPSSRE
jgi:hypothetical protein